MDSGSKNQLVRVIADELWRWRLDWVDLDQATDKPKPAVRDTLHRIAERILFAIEGADFTIETKRR